MIYYLHGARWNLTGHLRRIEQLRSFGFSVLAIDYRGFGKSDGDLPSEATVYEDARAGWEWLVARQPDPARRFIYGHSLGGAVAIDLAARLAARRRDARGLIVESTFTTLADIAAEMTFRWLPTDLILSQKFDSIAQDREVAMPVLVVHGAGDRFVPSRFSEALYAAAPATEEACCWSRTAATTTACGSATASTSRRSRTLRDARAGDGGRRNAGAAARDGPAGVLLILAETSDGIRRTPVVPAQAGTRWRTTKVPGFPPPTRSLAGKPARERRSV